MSGNALNWAGAVFMFASWAGILSLLVFCFSRLLNKR